MFYLMDDGNLGHVTSLVNDIIFKGGGDVLLHGDFTIPPKKEPHGVVCNGQPLTNRNTLWKIVAILIKDQLSDRATALGLLPSGQFAMWPRTYVVDQLRVLHDAFLYTWSVGGTQWIIINDITHAFGSVPF